jgi:hypothetical protein
MPIFLTFFSLIISIAFWQIDKKYLRKKTRSVQDVLKNKFRDERDLCLKRIELEKRTWS